LLSGSERSARMSERPEVWRDPRRDSSERPSADPITQAAVLPQADALEWGELPDTVTQVIAGLVTAIEIRDKYTYGHSLREAGHAVALAQEMGLPAQQVEDVRRGALLHDIGKLFVSERILHKPGQLTHDEFEAVKEHAALGAAVVSRVTPLRKIAGIIRHHHERFDGTGYPDGLAGDRIPLGARVVAVVSVFGAMIEERPYRRMLTMEETLSELERGAGSQFDPGVADVFARLVQRRATPWPKLVEGGD
jgi:putative nucleotidyltransferase with HDIG domain